jgi:ribonuclease HII
VILLYSDFYPQGGEAVMPVICGIDEAGRGPLAGPVTAAAVILTDTFPRHILKDSKKLSPAKRSEICSMLISECVYSTGWAWPAEIDRINIHHATLLAMKRAFEGLAYAEGYTESRIAHGKAELVLVDGLFIPDISCPAEAIVKGDDKIDEIKAASIIAKTARDCWMIRYSWIESEYFFEKHKGYPTLLHRQILERIGPSAIHRMSFSFASSCN